MYQGLNLQGLATEVERQQNAKRDFIAPVTELATRSSVTYNRAGQQRQAVPQTMLTIPSIGEWEVSGIAHAQIASHLGIPKPYYDKLRTEQPALLDENINTWFAASSIESRRMVRTLDANARAFLSDRYRPLDNYDLLQNVLPVISDLKLEVQSLGLTERNMSIKVFSQTLLEEVRVGDVVRAGIWISNSEVGHGALNISPMTERLVCSNGMISTDYAQRKYHVGRLYANTTEEEAREYFTDKTMRLDDLAFWAKAIDTLRAVMTEEVFMSIVNRMRESTERVIAGNPVKVVEVFGKQNGLTQEKQTNILTHLIKGGDLTQWGLANAVTRAAQDVDNYDDANTLEALGGNVITLSPKDWKVISTQK